MPQSPYCVIGSGPTGISCASALLNEGAEVLMIDAGAQCEEVKTQTLRRLAGQEPEAWDRDALRSIQSDYLSSRGSQAFKPVYGSDFAYAKNELAQIRQNGTKCLLSHARGGLSNVWGAAVLPTPDEDFADWPFGAERMRASYAAVEKILGVSGVRDDLERMFPFYHDPRAPIPLSRQAETLLNGWRKNQDSFSSSGILFGQARLAVNSADDGSGHHCRRVGLCLSGCPYSAIYNSQKTLAELQKNSRFAYAPGWIAEKIRETKENVLVECRSLDGKTKSSFQGRRVFSACGTLGSAKLLLESLNLPVKLPLLYQPYFLLPILAFFRTRGVDQERLLTLAQAFMEIKDPKISRRPIHLQFYGYNGFIKEKIVRILRHAPMNISRVFGPALWERLIVVQGYLHSEDSSPMTLEANASNAGGLDVSISGRLSWKTRLKILRVAAKLARRAKKIGGLPLLPLMELGMPGEGNHIGAIFPMSQKPIGFQSDLWGRVHGMRRAHAVDASILPSLSAATITFTVMANAYRIASEAARADREGSASGR